VIIDRRVDDGSLDESFACLSGTLHFSGGSQERLRQRMSGRFYLRVRRSRASADEIPRRNPTKDPRVAAARRTFVHEDSFVLSGGRGIGNYSAPNEI